MGHRLFQRRGQGLGAHLVFCGLGDLGDRLQPGVPQPNGEGSAGLGYEGLRDSLLESRQGRLQPGNRRLLEADGQALRVVLDVRMLLHLLHRRYLFRRGEEERAARGRAPARERDLLQAARVDDRGGHDQGVVYRLGLHRARPGGDAEPPDPGSVRRRLDGGLGRGQDLRDSLELRLFGVHQECHLSDMRRQLGRGCLPNLGPREMARAEQHRANVGPGGAGHAGLLVQLDAEDDRGLRLRLLPRVAVRHPFRGRNELLPELAVRAGDVLLRAHSLHRGVLAVADDQSEDRHVDRAAQGPQPGG
mmetsp:Transcript_114569/g.286349  ORF Transcript_114569/g.286349 Transcript_114569/m.286349 type:complete len:304 (-) Transcript_114569:602-1513(-)